LTGESARIFGLIALLAILNGVLIQIVMASRVIYGLASRQQLPALLGKIYQRTQTPVIATLLVSASVLALALVGNLALLAETTSVIMLVVFTIVNFALWRLKKQAPVVPGAFCVPRLVPLAGFLVSGAFAIRSAVSVVS
jgi:amino acid transporter